VTRFTDRTEAGRALAAEVTRHLSDTGISDRPLVLALPRGGVPVAAEVAAATGGDLDVVVARKIGVPGQPELGVGAVAEDGPPVFDLRALKHLGLTEDDLAATVEQERAELRRRIRRYRGDRPVSDATGRVAIVVDDGLATGVTARATLRWLRDHRPAHLLLTVPACSPQARSTLAADADAVLCLHTPIDFRAVGRWYADFRQLTDDDVEHVLLAYRAEHGGHRVRR
jgi:putative phosphoribosyl transferase